MPADGLYESLAADVPVPDNYPADSFSLVEENNRIKLQAVRIGEILLASCSCEAQVYLIKNLESRLDDVVGNQDFGYDYPCTQQGDSTWTCLQADPRAPGGQKTVTISDAVHARMWAQVHNDAAVRCSGSGRHRSPDAAAATGATTRTRGSSAWWTAAGSPTPT